MAHPHAIRRCLVAVVVALALAVGTAHAKESFWQSNKRLARLSTPRRRLHDTIASTNLHADPSGGAKPTPKKAEAPAAAPTTSETPASPTASAPSSTPPKKDQPKKSSYGRCPTASGDTDGKLLEDEPLASIFDQLSEEEINSVGEYMSSEMGYVFPPSLPEGTLVNTTDNYIYRIQLYIPHKVDALPWLDGTGPKPDRYAYAIVLRGALDKRDVVEFKVGPLPLVPGSIETEQLIPSGVLNYNRRPEDEIEWGWHYEALLAPMATLKPLFLNMTGGKFCPADPPDAEEDLLAATPCNMSYFSYWSYPSLLETGLGNRIHAMQFWFMPHGIGGDEYALHQLPLSFKLNMTLPTIQEWEVFDFEYCLQGPFATAHDLLSAWVDGELNASCWAPEWSYESYDLTWALTDAPRSYKRKGYSSKPGPRAYMPNGRRYNVSGMTSATGRSFSWMGWEGHFTADPYTGPKMYDIKFDGQRIAYEVSLQDQYVAYSGYGGTGGVYYYDSTYGIGQDMLPLRPGFDCPENAVYFDVVTMGDNGVGTARNAVCMFEQDMGQTHWRHTHRPYGDKAAHSDSIRNSEFVIRSIATISNYDYIWDFRFRLDATMAVTVDMAGYMVSSFYDPAGTTDENVPTYGTRVHKYAMAHLHDHLGGFKVDLDVLGVNNSFVTHSIQAGTFEDAGLAAPAWYPKDQIFKYVKTKLHETEVAIKMNYSKPTAWQFISQNATNSVGAPRGYAIVPMSTSVQLLPETFPVARAAAWTLNHLTVTRQKDNELYAHSALYDFHGCRVPVGSMLDYLNNETIVNQDLVAWVTVGAQHIPRSEDLPLIANFGTGFLLKPWNYFDELRSMDVVEDLTFETCAPKVGEEYDYTWLAEKTTPIHEVPKVILEQEAELVGYEYGDSFKSDRAAKG